MDTDRGRPVGSPLEWSQASPPPTPPLLRPPGAEPSSPRSSLVQRQPRRALFNWGRQDVRTWGPCARAAGGGGTSLRRLQRAQIISAQWAQRVVIKAARLGCSDRGRLWCPAPSDRQTGSVCPAPMSPRRPPALPGWLPAVLTGLQDMPQLPLLSGSMGERAVPGPTGDPAGLLPPRPPQAAHSPASVPDTGPYQKGSPHRAPGGLG